MELDFLLDECMGSSSVLDDISQWLADIADAHGSRELDVVALLIRRMAENSPRWPRAVRCTPPSEYVETRPQTPQAPAAPLFSNW